MMPKPAAAGTPNYDFTASPFEGSKSLRITQGDVVVSPEFDSQSEIWARFKFRYGSNPASNS